MNLEIDIDHQSGKSIVNLAGEIDAYTAPQLKEALLPLAEQEDYKIEVCFEGVNYMDSTGLGVFISVLKSTKKHNSHLKLINMQDRILRLFTITGLNEIIDINSTIRGGNE